jgi:transposase-like protein
VEFSHDEPPAGEDYTDDWEFTCAHCGHTFTRRSLIEANQNAIDATVEEMGHELARTAMKDIEKQLKGLGFKVKR